MAMEESMKESIDIVAASTGLLTLVAWLPPTASLLTIIWIGIRIYESKTVQRLVHKEKEDE
tara:strand:+ start:59 stop:241 length:183 start_codon:yes stop_codon:yes gene_type:complete